MQASDIYVYNKYWSPLPSIFVLSTKYDQNLIQ